MTDITERLRRLYVQDGTNYVQEAADLIDKLRAERDMWKDIVTQRDREIKWLVNDVHSCGPTCVRAGCVNRGLREVLRDVATQRPWVGLTDEEIWTVLQFRGYNSDTIEIAKAIEAKLKEKNR